MAFDERVGDDARARCKPTKRVEIAMDAPTTLATRSVLDSSAMIPPTAVPATSPIAARGRALDCRACTVSPAHHARTVAQRSLRKGDRTCNPERHACRVRGVSLCQQRPAVDEWQNCAMPGIVDPRPLIQQRLREIDLEFRPRLEAAQRQLGEVRARSERRAAKEALRSLRRQHRKAREEAQSLCGAPVAWFSLPKR